ncbi:hypothetical protein EGK75_11870 [Neisseria weixii]|uniref:Uncharacterized protein n=1 Tax=Neisseria weixii TaxID=1853276 RepID=A0A3N4MW76_9NEIS|nr:hypothetical protein [Neisseria weixii]RPD83950.1 hypothetical protein EGK74_11620 [Neisseria weixii]RPD84323.1 hypothetical protein EGK75_11870 [Neisseria weixii]
MESAIDKHTGKIIDAEQLWELDFVDSYGYLCRGCHIQVTPCSFRAENKKRPYFSAKLGHKPDCDVEGDAEIVKKAKKQRISTDRGFPASFPNRLLLKDTREVTSSTEAPAAISAYRTRAGRTEGTDTVKRTRTWAAQTIRSICRVFLNYPYDRDLPLSIPDINGKTYQEIFWRLSNKGIVQYKEPHIFYAPISWHKLNQTEAYLEIQTGCGRWENSKLIESYQIRVNWKDWRAKKRSVVLQEIEAARLECIQARGSKRKGWLFFIGIQDKGNPGVFYVTDHRLICCIVDEMIYPPG